MLSIQTIVIIGTGYTGRAIAARLAGGNFHLLLCDKDSAKAEALVNELKDAGLGCNTEAMQCHFESAWEADIIILAMNFREQMEVVKIIKDVVNQKILISLVHPGEEIRSGDPLAAFQLETLQEILPNTKIIGIFNDAPLNDQPVFEKGTTGDLITGNDDNATEIVSAILDSAGIRTIRAELLSPRHVLNDQQ